MQIRPHNGIRKMPPTVPQQRPVNERDEDDQLNTKTGASRNETHSRQFVTSSEIVFLRVKIQEKVK